MKSIYFKKPFLLTLKVMGFFLLAVLSFISSSHTKEEDPDEEYLEFLRTAYKKPIP